MKLNYFVICALLAKPLGKYIIIPRKVFISSLVVKLGLGFSFSQWKGFVMVFAKTFLRQILTAFLQIDHIIMELEGSTRLLSQFPKSFLNYSTI